MKNCHQYWFIEPFRAEYEDRPDREPAFLVNVEFKGSTYSLALFCDESNVPTLARLVIPNLTEDKVPEGVLPLVQIVKEHLMTVLRLAYRPDLQLFQFSAHSFYAANEPYHFSIKTGFAQSFAFDAKNIHSLFVHTMDFREELRLMADGLDERIPLQYRYLSFYKILEHRFKKSGKWDKTRLGQSLQPYQSRFSGTNLRGTLQAALHTYRDKCAHIRTGRKKAVLGVTHLNHRELIQVQKLIPILRDACRDVVLELGQGKLGIGSLEPWYEGMLTKQPDVRQS